MNVDENSRCKMVSVQSKVQNTLFKRFLIEKAEQLFSAKDVEDIKSAIEASDKNDYPNCSEVESKISSGSNFIPGGFSKILDSASQVTSTTQSLGSVNEEVKKFERRQRIENTKQWLEKHTVDSQNRLRAGTSPVRPVNDDEPSDDDITDAEESEPESDSSTVSNSNFNKVIRADSFSLFQAEQTNSEYPSSILSDRFNAKDLLECPNLSSRSSNVNLTEQTRLHEVIHNTEKAEDSNVNSSNLSNLKNMNSKPGALQHTHNHIVNRKTILKNRRRNMKSDLSVCSSNFDNDSIAPIRIQKSAVPLEKSTFANGSNLNSTSEEITRPNKRKNYSPHALRKPQTLKRTKWTLEEESRIIKGYQKYKEDIQRWARIKKEYFANSNRNSVTTRIILV